MASSVKKGETIIREVDIQGFDSIRKIIPKEDLTTIFITVPNKEELIDRIVNRATISDDELNKRKESMHQEFNRARDCDYMVENIYGELEKTIAKTKCDVVIIGTPIDLRRVIDIKQPSVRVTYDLQEIGQPTLVDVLKPYI